MSSWHLLLSFCLYLTLDMIIQMGCGGERISQMPVIGTIFTPLEFYHDLQAIDRGMDH